MLKKSPNELHCVERHQFRLSVCYEDFVNYHLYHLKTGFEK